MNGVRTIQRLNQRELEQGINPEGSWHTDYRDTAFVFFGGLPFELSEGDIITIFSQYGEPVWIKLARDKGTGKSRGFGWIKYEDQRSCDLAVDNLGGATVMDRVLKVDHARYKPRDDEDMRDNTMGEPAPDDPSDRRKRRRKRRRTDSPSESDSDDDRPVLPEELELDKAIQTLDEEDPMKESMVRRLQEKADTAVQKYKRAKRKEKERARKHERRHRHRSRDRPRIKDGGHSGDEDQSRSSRRHRHDRDRRDRSHERRRHSDDGSDDDDYKRSRSRRSPRPRHHDGHRDDADNRIRERERDRDRDRDRDRRKPSEREPHS